MVTPTVYRHRPTSGTRYPPEIGPEPPLGGSLCQSSPFLGSRAQNAHWESEPPGDFARLLCGESLRSERVHVLKKVLALVATAVSVTLVATIGGTATVAAAVTDPGGSSFASPSAGPRGPSAAVESTEKQGKGGRYEVPTGAYFNNPRGSWTDRLRIERQVRRAIDNTRKGSTIRIALYSFDRIPVAQRLIAARNRGVHVQLLLNDHQDTKAMKMLRARLGTDVDKKDFIYKCHSGCRTDNRKRLLHTKFYTFSKTGKSKQALFFGSANMTMNAARHQWNDLYLMDGDKELFAQYVALFDDMKKDYEKAQPPLPTFCGIPANGVSCDDAVDFGTTVTFPRLVGPKNDPIVQILNRVQCITTMPDGSRVRTRLAVSMHTIRGHRGNYLADAYRRKFAEGCQARFSFGLVGAITKGHLGAKTARGRLPLRSTGFDYNPNNNVSANNPEDKLDLTLDYYSHQKYLIIQGNYAGDPNANLVFTGSSNWGALGSVNDEILVAVQGKKPARQYLKNFNFEWRPGNSRNAYTTSYTHFRVPVVRMGADGEKVVTYRTVTRKHVTVDPSLVYRTDRLGPFWEGD
jgi:phosphatidylserine/phosphatidylglycerophosphate/cardiolipin synthase-like enzyme